MSKAKKIISMLLAVIMVLTVAPVNLLASAEAEGISYQDASFSGTTFSVDTSATTEVVRVAQGGGMFTLGNTIVAATRSGIPSSSGSYASVAYAGETPETPKAVFTITGVRPDATPTVTCSTSSVSFGECNTTSSGTTYTYSWDLSGTANAHTDLVFTITYKVAGSTYTAYAFSHVENILVMNGVVSYRLNKNGSKGTGRDSSIVQIQSHNMYSSMCQDSTVSNREVGFINYGTAEALSGGALLGCGSETDLDSSANAYGASVGVGINGTKVGSLIKVVKETTGTQRNCIYNNDSNRGESVVYLDRRTDTSLDKINLRVTLQNAESSDFGSSKFETFGIYHGHKTYGDEDGNSSLTGDATSSVIAVKTHAATGSDTVTSSAPFGHVMTTLQGTGPSKSTTATYNSTTGEYQYSIVFGLWSNANDRTNRTAVGLNLDFVVYDTTDLYNVYTNIMKGTGTYTIQNTTHGGTNYAGTVIGFDKGANPQPGMYADQAAYENFLAAYKAAGNLLREPDIGANWTFTNNANVDSTTNKSNTAQAEIDAATYNLVIAYQGLSAFNSIVDGYVNHVYKDAQGNETLLGQQVYAGKSAGTTMVGRYATIPGYEVIDNTPQSVLLSGKNTSESVTFYYQPVARQLVLVTNNDAGEVFTVEQRAGMTVDYSTLEHGVKEGYDFSHWTDSEGNVINGNFTMPNANYSLQGQWVPSPIEISCIPVIDGVERTDLVETFASVRPNADGTPVQMARPADLNIEGYIFVEYYEDAALTKLATWPKSFKLGDATTYTFYARMVDVYGKIIFEPNGGSAVNDVEFAPNDIITPPTSTREGYTFAGWYSDKELTQAVDWSKAMPDYTGFIAYAKWEANEYTISFDLDLDKKPTKYDTKELRELTGPADSLIAAEDFPVEPLKFGYIFDGWSLDGERFSFEEGVTTYPKEDIELVAIWRSTLYSAFADIVAYEKLSGEYVETDKVSAGDTVTFRMSTKTNFYTGSSVFVFMYDSNFYELVAEGTDAFIVNENNEYISGINAKIKGVTDDDTLPWPADFARTVTKADGSTAYYKAMMIAIDPTVSAGNYNCEPMSDGTWLVEFQLKVKDNATGSGTVFMDNAWTRNQENVMGTMFYGWAEEKTASVADTYNNVVTPILVDATATVAVNEEIPVEITIIADANGGTWADGTTKTFTGREEKEIIGYVAPTREGYTLTTDSNGKAIWYKVNDDGSFDTADTWAEGYYGKAAQNGFKYAAQWTANLYDINYYVDGELKKVVAAPYEASLADYAYTPAAKQGYSFAYWADAEGNEVNLDATTCPINGMSLYAVWEPATDTPFKVTATFIIANTGNPGTPVSKTFTGTTGYTVQIVEAVPEEQAANTIYITLDMLPTVQNGNYLYDPSQNTLPIEGVIAADGSLNLEVKYIGKPVTFTFDANGGAWADGSTTYEENSTFLAISQGPATEPTRDGYVFAGWTGHVAGTTPMQANRTFKAAWTEKTYTVTFNAVNSTLAGAFPDGTTVTTDEVKFGASIIGPASPVLDGYNFLGWAAADDATAAETLGTMDDVNGKVFYAVYAPIEYTVTYNITWGSYSETISDGPFYKGSVVTLREAEDKTGYEFDGWMINGEAAGTEITIGSSDVEVTGSYTAKNYDVIFDANGGFFDGDTTATTKAVSVAYETRIPAPTFEPAKAGYEFLGWAEAEDSTDIVTSYPVLTTTETITYYAVWKASYAAYTVKIYMQDATGAYPTNASETLSNTGLVGTDAVYAPEAIDGFTVDADKSVLSGEVIGDGSLVLEVYYSRNKYTVTWYNDNGDVIATDSVYYGAIPTAPEATKEGHTFKGWTPAVKETPIDGIEYYATFEANVYDATFNANGGAFADGSDTAVASTIYGTSIVAPNATKTGYTLLGWAYAGTTEIVIDETKSVDMVVGGLEFDAVWEVNKYTLRYNGYSNALYETFEVAYGTAAADMPVPSVDPTKEGYTFLGWSELPETMPAEQVRISSSWEIETYTFKYVDSLDGSEILSETVTYNKAYTAPADPTKEGYTFAGWDKTIPTKIADYGNAGEVIVYTANWTINQYTITFDVAGGSEIAAITQDYNTAVTAPADPTREGYTFTGWDKAIPATMPAENTTITASWAINQYTITFDVAGGSEIAAITQDFGTAVTAPADPTREGYTFAGWDKEIPTTMPANNVTITASWTINAYTITWVIDGETFKTDADVVYGTAVTAPVPAKTGYVFSGWAEEIPATMPANDLVFTGSWVAATDTKYTVNINTMDVDGNYVTDTNVFEGVTDSTVTAVYTVEEGFELGANSVTEGVVAADGSLVLNVYINRKTVTITFDSNGGTDVADITALYGAAVNAPADPTREGYTFAGWNNEVPATMPSADVALVANWTINSYVVNFLDAEDDVFATYTLEYLAEISAPTDAPAKEYYTFEGWSLTKITEILNPEDLADVALIDFENAAPTVPVDGLTIYPVFVRVPVALELTSTTAIVTVTSAEGEPVVGYITGLETRLTEDVLTSSYIAVEGDGRIEVTLTKFDICGTGTEVRVVDNVTNETVGTYYIVIYGDINGDADIDATDVAMIEDEAIGVTYWSSKAADTYDQSKVIAADVNKDGKVKSLDSSLLTDVTLFLAEIDQQTGDIILY